MSMEFMRRANLWPRVTVPDVYPRFNDPVRPAVAIAPQAPTTSGPAKTGGIIPDMFRRWRTRPSQRQVVYQRFLNFGLTVGTTAGPIVNQILQADSIVIDVPSTAANSIFLGASGVSTTNGIEIRPGTPLSLATDNTRQLWELQGALENIAALLSANLNAAPPNPVEVPRVVINVNDLWLVATASTNISIMLFFVPELQ